MKVNAKKDGIVFDGGKAVRLIATVVLRGKFRGIHAWLFWRRRGPNYYKSKYVKLTV